MGLKLNKDYMLNYSTIGCTKNSMSNTLGVGEIKNERKKEKNNKRNLQRRDFR